MRILMNCQDPGYEMFKLDLEGRRCCEENQTSRCNQCSVVKDLVQGELITSANVNLYEMRCVWNRRKGFHRRFVLRSHRTASTSNFGSLGVDHHSTRSDGLATSARPL